MASMITPILSISLLVTWFSQLANAKVFMILMEDDSVTSYKTKQVNPTRVDADTMVYKEQLRSGHDMFLESLLEKGTYTKLYSYTHLLNGFAIHLTSDEVLSALRNATGVRAIHEDVKMEKLTTHTPDFLGLPDGVWSTLGGAETSGEGVVIGFVDTGINPNHPSFVANSSLAFANATNFRGSCATGEKFPSEACNGKIVAAQYFAQGAIAAGDFNATRDYASPFDADGHGSHTASTAAGNHQMPVSVNGFQYGYASGMAPGARIAAYKALYTFGGYMSDVVAAVDQAVEDGVDILSLSVGPSSVPPGPSVFLNVLEVELLLATKAGVLVVQAAGNGGPSFGSILSFSPWITTVAASTTDRKYTSTIMLGNGHSYSGAGLAPSTAGEASFPIAAAADVCLRNNSDILEVDNCRHPEFFISTLARGKLIICTYTFNLEYEAAGIATVADTIDRVGAAGVVITMDPNIGLEQVKGTTMTLQVPAIILNDLHASSDLWRYYNSNTVRSRTGRVVVFGAKARILDGRQATYSQHAPVVAFYSSRGPDVNNALLQTADVLKPNVMAPGSSIWAAWSPSSEGDPNIRGQNFALVTGTSMATPHIAGVAALIKHRHPKWGPAAITSAMMTSADVFDLSGSPILAQLTNRLAPATPFDLGAGFINSTRAIDPGLIFNAHFEDYVQFLCDVPGVDDESVRRVLGIECPPSRRAWCSDLNTASIAVSNLVGWRRVVRRVSNVGSRSETYRVTVKEPFGVRVTVSPQVLGIRGHGSRHLRIFLRAIRATRAYTFGEIVLHGSRKHVVRVPIAVYVSSSFES